MSGSDSQPLLVVKRADQVVVRCIRAVSLLTRMRGLLGRSSLPSEEGLWLIPCNAIHMWFMKFPIDAVFLDRQLRVVRIFHAIQPWRVTPIVLGAHSCLEIAAGLALKAGLREGDTLTFEQIPP